MDESNHLFNTQKSEGFKRKHGFNEEVDSKKKAITADSNSENIDNIETTLNSIKILPDAKELDINEIKKIISNLEKKISKNREIREKNKDLPEKFMDSECDLFEILQQTHSLTGLHSFFDSLIELNFISCLSEILNHENTDIATTAVELLYEMIDLESEVEYEIVEKMSEYFINNGMYELCLNLLKRIDISDTEESDHVKSCLHLLETFIELRPELIKKETNESFIEWMIKFLKNDAYQQNLLHVSEILNISLQNIAENREFFSRIHGIEAILICVSKYRKKDPQTNDEIEYMQNLFDIICIALLQESNKKQFVHYEGIQLMILILRGRLLSQCGALKVISFLLSSGSDNVEYCNKFVEYSGLGGLFPLFLSLPSNIKRLGYTNENIEEYSCVIIFSLFKYLNSENRSRVVSKFIEKDFVKLDRLFELFIKYNDKVNIINKKINQRRHSMEMNDNLIDDDLEDQFYMERLEHGLFTLQIVVCNLYELSADKNSPLPERINKILMQWQISKALLSEILKEYIEHLGENDNSEMILREKQRLLSIINSI